ncbi:hypothetical protein DENIS_3852 [Desulfonema ishimotonii]|uniref:Uncharacterized protein n=1 Tax=Desulfonema ishimotonii TaxID=45657 RepID=A0A401G0W1_9BACT|nr:hypothetical protein [Desulfonema ishimotonii]GBC62868.1 hypothetical protein DENIS_3852 [Desulfonema ishimotonii]
MKAKKLIVGLGIVGMIWGSAGAAWAGGSFEHRQQKQTRKIYNGVKKGCVSHKEFRRLTREQWRIEHTRKKALADGRISRKEKKRLNKMQRRAGKHIRRATHNRYVRYDRRY